MNDPKPPLPIDSEQPIRQDAPVSASRRRFAKGAAPVVLGSLLSKPVLGAEYICTVSGNASGNASAHLTDDAVCDVGNDVNYWLANAWPAYSKGGLPDPADACSFDPVQGTLFKDVTSGGATLANVFFYRSPTAATNPCRTVFDSSPSLALGARPASLYQVLARTGSGEVFRLGRATVASLLNAADPTITYPISAQRIIEMFNAVKDGGTYHVDGANLELRRLGVIEYLESLYS